MVVSPICHPAPPPGGRYRIDPIAVVTCQIHERVVQNSNGFAVRSEHGVNFYTFRFVTSSKCLFLYEGQKEAGEAI